MSKENPQVGFVSLGCPKATVDSEQILTRLRAEGYGLSDSYEQSDLVIINTCGFIDAAVDESLDSIREAVAENGKVIVTGCLGSRAEWLQQQVPEILAVTGPQQTAEVMQAVHQQLPAKHDPFFDLLPPQGLRLTPSHYAYLKISEGCNHRCSFCIIPSMRGDLVSRPIHEVMDEAERLAESGVKEILVISQDTSAYGVDRKYATEFWQGQPLQTRIHDLARALGQFGIWVRLHYVYPYPHVDKLIPLMAEGLILPYLDIPFQHASPTVLKAMKRPGSQEKVLERLQQWREICPEIAIRSTFIVGFPGETDQDFDQLLDFLDEAQLDRAGCFTYSAVEGAAANELPNPVEEAVKQERQETFMREQQAISRLKLQQRRGSEMQLLVDAVDDQQIVARSYADAPEIDGQVILSPQAGVQIGDWVQAKITDSDEYDLMGHIL